MELVPIESTYPPPKSSLRLIHLQILVLHELMAKLETAHTGGSNVNLRTT